MTMTSYTFFLCVFVVTTCWMNFSSASYLLLTADPPVIHPVMTTKLQLRCSVKNNTNSRETPLTQLLFNDSSYQQEVNATQTPITNTNRFLAITIMKVNEKSGLTEAVASVTGCEVPVVQHGFSNIKAEGSSEGSPESDEQGYLLLTWNHPLNTDAGIYQCEATFLDHQSFSQTLRTSQDVQANEPSLSDLVTYFSANSKYITALETQVQDLAKANQDLAADVKRLCNATFEPRALTSDNIQMGKASCYNQFIYFPRAFNNEPVIFTSVSSFSMERLDYYSHSFSINVEDVSNHGFRVNCTTSGYYMTASFDWLGIGS